jgi:hypothetical protein
VWGNDATTLEQNDSFLPVEDRLVVVGRGDAPPDFL